MDDIIATLCHATSNEKPDTIGGPSLCDYYQRTEKARQARRAPANTVGDEMDVDGHEAVIERQGFVNGFKSTLGLCVEVI